MARSDLGGQVQSMSSEALDEGAPAARLGGAEDEDPVGLGGAAGLGAPQLGHLAQGGDVVERDARESIALRLGGLLPGALGQPDAALDPSAAVGLDVTDDEHDHGVVGQDRAEPGEDVAQEGEVRLAVVGVVEGRVDGAGVEARGTRCAASCSSRT